LAYIAGRLEAFRILEPIDVLFFPGSTHEYYERLAVDLRARILLEREVTRVRRTPNGVLVSDAAGEHSFDQVILACNANHAALILEDATIHEREFLLDTRYQTSEIVVHRDVSILPRDQSRWRHYNLRHTGVGEDYEITALSSALQVRSAAPILVTYRPRS